MRSATAPAMGDQLIAVASLSPPRLSSPGMITEVRRNVGLAAGIVRSPGKPAIITGGRALPFEAPLRPQCAGPARKGPTSRMANCVVCTPTARPPAPASQIVTRQRALPSHVQFSLLRQSQRMRRNGEPILDRSTNFRWQVGLAQHEDLQINCLVETSRIAARVNNRPVMPALIRRRSILPTRENHHHLVLCTRRGGPFLFSGRPGSDSGKV